MPKFTEYVESDYDNELEDRESFRTRILRKNVGVIDMEFYDDDVTMYCPHCKAAGFQVKLGPRVLFPDEKRPPDYDQFLQCPDCAEVIAAYVVEHDATIIRDDIETISNPFENTTEIMGAVAKRTTKAGKRALDKRRQQMNRPHHKDKEIDLEMARHGDRVKVIHDSSP